MNSISVVIFICALIHVTVAISYGEGCESQIANICYEDSSYPHQDIETLWQEKESHLMRTFGNIRDDIEDIAVDSDYTPCEFCPTQKRMTTQPLSIIEDRNQRLYVVSTDKYPRPSIEIRVCEQDGQCKIDGLPNNYVTKCVQRFTKLHVLTFNSTSKQFVGNPISFPSFCECQIHVDTN